MTTKTRMCLAALPALLLLSFATARAAECPKSEVCAMAHMMQTKDAMCIRVAQYPVLQEIAQELAAECDEGMAAVSNFVEAVFNDEVLSAADLMKAAEEIGTRAQTQGFISAVREVLAMTGSITIAGVPGTSAATVNIAPGTGAKNIYIGAGSGANLINLGGAATTVNSTGIFNNAGTFNNTGTMTNTGATNIIGALTQTGGVVSLSADATNFAVNIGTGLHTGAVNIGNATGNTAVTGSLTASNGLVATAGGAAITGTTAINTTGSATTSIGNSTAATGVTVLGGSTGGINIGTSGATKVLIGDSTSDTYVSLTGGIGAGSSTANTVNYSFGPAAPVTLYPVGTETASPIEIACVYITSGNNTWSGSVLANIFGPSAILAGYAASGTATTLVINAPTGYVIVGASYLGDDNATITGLLTTLVTSSTGSASVTFTTASIAAAGTVHANVLLYMIKTA